MRTPLRLGGYAGLLALAFGAAFAVGAAAEPLSTTRAAAAHGGDHARPSGGTLPGLASTVDGYTFAPAAATLPAGSRVPFRFRVTRPDGRPLTSYARLHDKELHLVVVRRDLTGYQHVHPVRGGDGTWTAALDLPAGGSYRAFADFRPSAGGGQLTLGTNLSVAGTYTPAAMPAPTATAQAGDLSVRLDGAPLAGRESELTFTVTRGGRPVTDLQPYLGAFGHLVSLRVGDLAYLHTHPAEEAASGTTGGPRIRFGTTFPTPGRYRLYLDVRAGGAVRTAAFTVDVARGSA